MHFARLLSPCLVVTTLLAGCLPDSKNIGDTLGGDSDSTATSAATTDDPTPSTSVSESQTGDDGGETLATTGDDSHGTTGAVSHSTTGEETTGTTAVDTTGTTADDTTGTTVDPGEFERFNVRSVAGLCPPEADCDGFVELLSTRILRVEKVGDLGNPVTEVEISAEDFALALEVFTDPALVAVLDSPEPLCNPPSDVFETMELELGGTLHDATTTFCDDPPLQAARQEAVALREKYVP
ncbi:hypothetical protein [Nannocystis bainbridge]|uniref:Uncharacterized protein n=1 Tax=Nannocystis bainbridge TaxID=2995303 RepID=A0ABT5EAJ5_9BACT|nr:hypothetical protein [Nannocystis bainbridge]MDC0722877.1 hypothetical protein [Nannocystis bainbridge]